MLSRGIKKNLATRISARRVVITSLTVDILDIILNLTVALVTGSMVMVAEALQGLADFAASAFLLIGLVRSERPADVESPFGYGRELYLWTLLAGILMVTVTATLSVYFGWQRVVNPQPLDNVVLAYVVLGIGLISNGYSLTLSFRRLLGSHPPRLIFHAFRQSVLVETKTTFILDLMGSAAAALGLFSLLLLGATSNGQFDGLGAIMIGLTVAVLAVVLLLGVQDLLIGRRAHPVVEERIRKVALTHPQVTDVLGMKTMHIGPEKFLVNLDVHFAHGLTTQEIERVIDELKENVKTLVPEARHVQIELETPKAELRALRRQ